VNIINTFVLGAEYFKPPAPILIEHEKKPTSAAMTWPNSMSRHAVMSRYDSMLWHKGYGTQVWKFQSLQKHKFH